MKNRFIPMDQNCHELFKTLFYSIVLVLSFNSNAQILSESPKNIVLLIGQSNMEGRANLMDQDHEIVQNAFLLNSINQWVPLKSALNIHSSIRKPAGMQRFNLGYTFAQEMVKNIPNKSLGLVVNARGGTKIEQWLPGTHYFKEAIRRSKLAIGEKGKVIAVLWLQGESNLGDDDPEFETYYDRLKAIIFGIRKELKNDQIIFIASELGKTSPENEIFKKMLDRIDTEIPNASTIKSEGTSTFDGTHYDHKSLELLGKRFSDKLMRLF